MNNLTYRETGVDYSSMDPFKRKCQIAAQETSKNAERLGVYEIGWSRGESAFLLQMPSGFIAHVEEGLGTKNLVADYMYCTDGVRTYYNSIAQDTVAMIVNDMITLGFLPVSLAMHLAVGDSKWFEDERRTDDIIAGWKKACDLSRCVWGGGETPTLKQIVNPLSVVLSGSGIGFSKKLFKPKIEEGNAIIFFESSGIHANGLTLARSIGEKKYPREGYFIELPDGSDYGEALLDPTHIYVGVIEDLINAGIEIGYAVNITGHGWRKIMRLNEPFTYRIKEIPKPQPVFDFIQKYGPVSDEEAYGNLNMGAGFAIFVKRIFADDVVGFVNGGNYGFKALNAGIVEVGEKQVIIEPKGLIYKGDTLEVR